MNEEITVSISGKTSKSAFVVFLSCVMLLQACMSGHTLTREEINSQQPAPEERVWFILKDGGTITADPYHHVYVSEPSSFVQIYGEVINVKTNTSRDAIERMDVVKYDSLTNTRGASGEGMKEELVYWISDSVYIVFTTEDVLRVTPDDGVGYWCRGKMETGNERRPYEGMINETDIAEIKVPRFSLLAPLPVVGGLGIGIILCVVALAVGGFSIGPTW